MNKIIVIKKYTNSVSFWPNLNRKKQIKELSVEDIIHKYQGFEGELIFYSFDINEMLKKNSSKEIILYVALDSEEIPQEIENTFSLMGYEFGACEEDYVYSSIFNEILFGSCKELVLYKDQLNKFFLFNNKEIAEKYSNLHDKLLLEGADVEDDSELKMYKVWKYNK